MKAIKHIKFNDNERKALEKTLETIYRIAESTNRSMNDVFDNILNHTIIENGKNSVKDFYL